MIETFVDLHCHSTASDGSLSPAEVVALAKRQGLSGLALTDHDTIAGITAAANTAAEMGIDFIAGIEISAEFSSPGTLHILGYGIDPASPVLTALTEQLIAGRDNRNPQIIAKLNALGMKITLAEVEAEAEGIVIGRPHIAAVLLRKGYVHTVKQAFDLYLAQGSAAYAEKERLTPRQAIEKIGQAGGLAVLAHPTQLRTSNPAELERVVKDLVDLGLAGIEVFHSDHSEANVTQFRSLAKRWNLLETGGSDFHGRSKPTIGLGRAGKHRVPREMFDRLQEALSRVTTV